MATIQRKLLTTNFGEISRKIALTKERVFEKIDDEFDPATIDIPEEYGFIIDFVNNNLYDENQDPITDIGAIFLTGKAGTGKSTAIKYVKHMIKNSIVVAPTTIAAMNVKGSTIHSFFGFVPGVMDPSEINTVNQKIVPVLHALDLLIVDEISMVSSAMVDCMDAALRLAKNSDKPFGGIKMLFVGDLFQLPPIVGDEEVRKYFAGTSERYNSEFFISADVFKNKARGCNIHAIELKVVKRQDVSLDNDNAEFVKALNAIRTNDSDHIFGALDFVNEKCFENKKNVHDMQSGSIALVPTKAGAKEFNKTQIDRLEGESTMYKGVLKGGMSAEMIKQFQAPDELELKVGAQVVFVTNNKPEWINGHLGIVEELGKDVIKVKTLKDGFIRSVKRESFNKYTYKYDIQTKCLSRSSIEAFVQFPLALGWAITIHKSQGMTLENVIVDIKKQAFAEGQTYVALSRVKSIDGLILRSQLEYGDIKVNDQVLQIYSELFPNDYRYEG